MVGRTRVVRSWGLGGISEDAPIFNKGNKNKLLKYRPVSLTLILRKLME